MTPAFLVFGLLLTVAACGTTVRVHYQPMVRPLAGAVHQTPISLTVLDRRSNHNVARTDTWQSVELEPPLPDLLHRAFEQALIRQGFHVVERAPVRYIVAAEECVVRWNGGIRVPVTSDVRLEVQLLDERTGEHLVRPYSVTRQRTVIGGGWPARQAAESVLDEAVRGMLDQVLEDRVLEAWLERRVTSNE